jgi:outer membrane protein assembly factor BamB
MRVALVLLLAACSGGEGHSRSTVREHAPGGQAIRISATSARRLAVSWSSELQGSPGAIASDRDGAVVSIDNDAVVALDAHGDEQWSTPVPGAGLGWPSLAGGLVIVPIFPDSPGAGGCAALDRESGEPMWAYEEPQSQGVAVTSMGNNAICAMGNGVVAAVDRVTGKRRWRVSIADRDAVPSGVSIAQRAALAVDAATGSVAFTVNVGSSSAVVLLDLATGANRGVFDLTRYGQGSAPVSTGPGLLAVALSRPGMVCVIDIRKNHFGSCVAVAARDGFDPASIPLAVDGLVVVAARDGVISAVDLSASKLRWAMRVPNPILSARLVTVGGVVMFSDWTRVPWALHLADGSAVELPQAEGWAIASVADTDGGFELAMRNMDGGWIERWVPA